MFSRFISFALIVICPIYVFGFWGKTLFPNKVKNECNVSFNPKFPHLASVTVNALIDLKNQKGELEEKAYIYLTCGVDKAFFKPADQPKMKTVCEGIRINGLSRNELNSSNVFMISSKETEVVLDKSQSKATITWQGASTFEVKSGRSFSWEMKSSLSGNRHYGQVECK